MVCEEMSRLQRTYAHLVWMRFNFTWVYIKCTTENYFRIVIIPLKDPKKMNVKLVANSSVKCYYFAGFILHSFKKNNENNEQMQAKFTFVAALLTVSIDYYCRKMHTVTTKFRFHKKKLNKLAQAMHTVDLSIQIICHSRHLLIH